MSGSAEAAGPVARAAGLGLHVGGEPEAAPGEFLNPQIGKHGRELHPCQVPTAAGFWGVHSGAGQRPRCAFAEVPPQRPRHGCGHHGPPHLLHLAVVL